MNKTLILAIFSISLMGCSTVSNVRVVKRVVTSQDGLVVQQFQMPRVAKRVVTSHHRHVWKADKYNRCGDKVVRKTKFHHGHCKTSKK